MGPSSPGLPQDVQVNRRGFHQREQHLLNVLNVEALLGLSLPAAQHHIIDLFGTEPGTFQNPALSDALNDLEIHTDRDSYMKGNVVTVM